MTRKEKLTLLGLTVSLTASVLATYSTIGSRASLAQVLAIFFGGAASGSALTSFLFRKRNRP